MLQDLASYDAVVHAIYDAALKPELWPEVVRNIAALHEAPRALLWTYFHKPAQGGFSFSHNITQASQEIWAAKGSAYDPWVQSAGAQGRLVEGVVSLDHDLVPEAELVQTPFYNEILAPMDIAKVCSGIVFDGTDACKLPVALSVYRSLRDPRFARVDADTMERLLAHLSRALGVMFHLRDRDLQLAASLSALDRLGSGVVLLDGARRMTFANQAALSLLEQGDPVGLMPAVGAAPLQLRLHRRLAGLEQGFQRALTLALQPVERDAEAHFSQALLLPASDGRPACVVHAAPLPTSHGFATGGPQARAIVFLYDLQAAAVVQPQQLCVLFGMTRAEARAALQVTQGGSLEEMAARLHVTVNTLKTQLKAAYAKSGTHRQVDLLKLLLALASR